MVTKKKTGTTSTEKKAAAPRSKTAARKKAPAARQKTAPKAKSAPRKKNVSRQNGPSLGQELKRVFLGIGILVAICLTTAMLVDIFIRSGKPAAPPASRVVQTRKAEPSPGKAPSPPAHRNVQKKKAAGELGPVVADIADLETKKKAEGLKKKNGHPFVYEVFDDHDRERLPSRTEVRDKAMPKVAIIIDDIGYDRKVAMGLFEACPDISFSVLPFSPYGKSLAAMLSQKGAELMLHLPMEPKQYPKINPGPGALLSSMDPDSLLTQLRLDLNEIPGIVGVNNHMGSELSSRMDQMNQIFTVLKKRQLFFIDSRTASDSKGLAAARMFRLSFSQRDVFLDNVQKVDYISGQLHQLVKVAVKHGTAIGIGHPYASTLKTLQLEIPKIEKQVKFVRASELVAVPD